MEDAREFGAVVVAGGSRGIGEATARLAAARGFAVAVNFASGEAEAHSVVRAIREQGGKAVAIRGDVGRDADIVQLFREAERELGPVRGLATTAGVTGVLARVEAVTAVALERSFAVNVAGAFLCAREAVKRMSTRHGGAGGSVFEHLSPGARDGGA